MDDRTDQDERLLSTELPPSVREFLAYYLPLYAESRERWPLWTYERTFPHLLPDGRSTWHWSGGWADRMAWSPARLYQPVYEALTARVEKAGGAIVSWQPGQSGTFVEKLTNKNRVSSGGKEGTEAVGWLTLPYLFLALVAAISAQTATSIPETPEQIEFDDFWFNEGLGHLDGDELARSLFYELVTSRNWKSDVLPQQLSERIYDEDIRKLELGVGHSTSLLSRMLSYQLRAVSHQGALGPEEQKREKTRLAFALLDAVGLLPDRQSGGRKYVLDKLVILRLYEEAVEIVDDVRSWRPDQELMNRLVAVTDADPRQGIDHMRRERARRIEQLPDIY